MQFLVSETIIFCWHRIATECFSFLCERYLSIYSLYYNFWSTYTIINMVLIYFNLDLVGILDSIQNQTFPPAFYYEKI